MSRHLSVVFAVVALVVLANSTVGGATLHVPVPRATVDPRSHRHDHLHTPGPVKQTKRTTPSFDQSKIFGLRGGGDGGDAFFGSTPTTAGKVFNAAYLIQGSLFSLFPTNQAKWYGWGGSPSVTLMTQTLGHLILLTGVGSYCLIYCNMEPVKAWTVVYAVGTLLVLSIIFGPLIFGPQPMTIPVKASYYSIVALSAIGLLAGETEQTWATAYFKAFAVVHALLALQCCFLTDSAIETYQIPSADQKPGLKRLVKGLGHFYLVLEIYALLILSGKDPVKSLGYTSLSGLVHFVDSLLIDQSAGKQSSSLAAYLFWFVFFAVFIPATTLSGSIEATTGSTEL